MYDVYFDSGTSNTRAYLIQREYVIKVIDVLACGIGSKDSSITGGNQKLLIGLKELYDRLLEKNKITDDSVDGVYASGMAASPFGIKEVPHLSTPVSLEKLSSHLYKHYENEYFKRDIYLIRGVKTIGEDFVIDIYNISRVNNMRGEEIEIFGILSDFQNRCRGKNLGIFLPGSHTQVAYVKQGEIQDLLSTFSGELYHAIATSTILSDSIRSTTDDLDEEMVMLGFNNLKEYGISRALYIAHATKIFNVCSNQQRKSYLEGVINGSVVQAFENTSSKKWIDLNHIVIAGSNARISRVYELLLKKNQEGISVSTVIAPEEQSFAVKGFMALLKRVKAVS